MRNAMSCPLPNQSQLDKKIRFFVALAAAFGALFLSTGLAQTILSVIAFVAFFTSFTGFCPLYSVFGFSTKSTNKSSI